MREKWEWDSPVSSDDFILYMVLETSDYSQKVRFQINLDFIYSRSRHTLILLLMPYEYHIIIRHNCEETVGQE